MSSSMSLTVVPWMEAEVAVVPGAGSGCPGCAIATVTAAFLQPTTLNIGLDFHPCLVRIGAAPNSTNGTALGCLLRMRLI